MQTTLVTTTLLSLHKKKQTTIQSMTKQSKKLSRAGLESKVVLLIKLCASQKLTKS